MKFIDFFSIKTSYKLNADVSCVYYYSLLFLIFKLLKRIREFIQAH